MASKDLVCVVDDDPFPHDAKGPKLVSQDEFVLTKVVGLTNISKSALDCNQATGYVAFPASCMLVLLDPKTNDQKFMESPSGKSISCVCFSDDGRLVAFGETGLKPYVSVWTLKDHKEHGKFMVDHSVGVKTIAFHPKSFYVVVIGLQDLNIGVWDYLRGQRLALTKWQTIPLSMTIPKSGSSVILCGHRKITLFNLDKVNSNCYETNVFEERKAVLLGRQSEYTFVDITSGKGKFDKNVYTVTTCGYLCEIKLGDILIDKAIKVDSHAYCVRFALNHVFVGCCEGVVKICSPDILTVAVAVSLDQLLGSEAFPQGASKLYLDTTAIAVNEKDSIVTCIYANCSIYSWQINSFTNNIECSVLLPSSEDQLDSPGLDSCVSESVCRANMFRSFMGCLDVTKGSRLLDTETLAARNGMRCHHGLIHLIKGGAAKNQHATAYRFSPDGRDVICGNEAGEIKVYDASSGVLRRVIEAHSSQVMCIELMYDNDYQLVCSGGRDRIIFILNAKTDFSLVQVLCDHSAAITAISLVSHGGLLTLVSAAADNLILVRRATPGNSLKFTVTGQIVEPRCNKALNVSGDYIITGDKNGNIKLFKADPIFNPKLTKTLKTIPRNNQGTSVPRPMCMDPTGSFIATTQNPGQIVVYHLQTGQPIASLSGQTDATAIKFTNCLKYMVSSTSNGCTMIWRLPERMTEFLKSKRSKAFEVEIAKETTYETTYVSCVKVCKEMGMRGSNQGNDQLQYSGSDSNHNYESDATPSIESLSFLRVAHNREKDPDRHSICSTGSYISCSTCTGSCSDTVHWCPSSDSSVQTNSGTDRLFFGSGDCGAGRILEDGQCRKVGVFKQKSSEKLNQPCSRDEAAADSQDNKIVKNEKGLSGHSATKDCNNFAVADFMKDEGKAGNKEWIKYGLSNLYSKNMAIETAATPDTDSTRSAAKDVNLGESDIFQMTSTPAEVKTTNIRRIEARVLCNASENNKDDQQRAGETLRTGLESVIFSNPLHVVKDATHQDKDSGQFPVRKSDRPDCQNGPPERGPDLARRHLALPSNSPLGRKRMLSPSSPKSNLSYKTACSPRPTTSKDTSCSPANSAFFSPSSCPSSEAEDAGGRFRTASVRQEHDKVLRRALDLAQDGGQTSSLAISEDSLSALTSSSINVHMDPNVSSSLSDILLPASVKEPVLENTFLKDILQTFHPEGKKLRDKDSETKNRNRKTCFESATSPQGSMSTFLNKQRVLNPSVTISCASKNEASSNKSEDFVGDDHSHKKATNGEMLVATDKPVEEQNKSRQGSLPDCDESNPKNFGFADEEEVYNYHSITRDEHGKLRRVANPNMSSPQSPLFQNQDMKSPMASPREFFSPKDCSHSEQRFHDSMMWNIQCCRCSHRDEANTGFSMNTNSVTCDEDDSRMLYTTPSSQAACEERATGMASNACQPDNAKQNINTSEGCRQKSAKDMSDQRLEEYFSELRQCLQLTNTQETVYKLACDSQDQELMDLLELVLKKKPTSLSEPLPPNDIEAIRRNLMESENNGQQSQNVCNSKISLPSNSPLISTEKETLQKPMLSPNRKALTSSDVDKLEKVERPSRKLANQAGDNPPRDDSTARTIISLVGQILTNRKAAHELKARTENPESIAAPCASDGKSVDGCGEKTQVSAISMQEAQGQLQKQQRSTMQQYLMRKARSTCSRHHKDNNSLSVLKEADEGKLPLHEETDNSPDSRRFKNNSLIYPPCLGHFYPGRALDSGARGPVSEKYSYTRFLSADRKADRSGKGHADGQTLWASISSDVNKRKGPYPAEKEGIPQKQMPENAHQQPKFTKVALTREPSKAQEEARDSRVHNDNTGTTERKYTPPIVELFRDQDDYLKKLKEVREKFEMSIQALSNERKSRLAEEEKQFNK